MQRAAAIMACASLVWAHVRVPAAATRRHPEEALVAVSAPRGRAEQGRSPCQIDLVRAAAVLSARAAAVLYARQNHLDGAVTDSDWRRWFSAV